MYFDEDESTHRVVRFNFLAGEQENEKLQRLAELVSEKFSAAVIGITDGERGTDLAISMPEHLMDAFYEDLQNEGYQLED